MIRLLILALCIFIPMSNVNSVSKFSKIIFFLNLIFAKNCQQVLYLTSVKKNLMFTLISESTFDLFQLMQKGAENG